MIIGQNLYSNANFQRNTERKVGFGVKFPNMAEYLAKGKVAGYLGEEISPQEAQKGVETTLAYYRKLAAKGNKQAIQFLKDFEKAKKKLSR
mgnify:CR=1 FL=1